MAHKLTWLGHSAFRLTTAQGPVLLIDPFLEGNPSAPVGPGDIATADAILVTHDHGDHVGQTLNIAVNTGATVVAMFDTMQSLLQQGLPEAQGVGMNIGGTVTVAGTQVKMVQATHSSATGVAAGYIITLPDGACVYHAGDTGLFASMELFAKFHRIDLALLPIGGHFTMDPQQAAYACKLLQARGTVPMHWKTFGILEQSTDAYAEHLAELSPDTRHYPLEPGKTLSFSKTADDLDCQCE